MFFMFERQTSSLSYESTPCVQVLLPAASLLQLMDVRQVCCDFLQSQLHPTNCLGIRAFADLHTCTQLLNQAHTFAGEPLGVHATNAESYLGPLCVSQQYVYVTVSFSFVCVPLCLSEQHFTEVVQGEEFLGLSLQQVCSLISSDKLTVSTEEKVRRHNDTQRNTVIWEFPEKGKIFRYIR